VSTPKYEKKMHLIHYYHHPLVKGFPGRKLKMSCKEHISPFRWTMDVDARW